MKPIEFRRALKRLGWTLEGAGLRLGVLRRGKGDASRIQHFLSGARDVPPMVEEHIRTHEALAACRAEVIRLTDLVRRLQERRGDRDPPA